MSKQVLNLVIKFLVSVMIVLLYYFL